MKALWLGLLFAALALPASADDGAMGKAAAGFYVAAHSAGSGLPDAAARGRLAPRLTPRLAALLDKATTGEDAFAAANKGAPPLVEGDLYSSLFEGPTSYAIGACSGDAKGGHCAVDLIYHDKSGDTRWTDTLYLASTGDGWKVDDIGYGGTWDFGNKGRLSETLEQVASFVTEKE